MFLMKASVGLALGHALFNTFSEKKWSRSLIVVSLCLLAYFQWPIVHLWGFWAFVLLAGYGKNNLETVSLAASLLVLWMAQETSWGSWTAIPWNGIAFFLICYLGIRWLEKTYFNHRLFYIILSCCIINTSYDIVKISLSSPDIQIAQDKNVLPSYSPGPMLAKILNGKLVEPGQASGDIGISSVIFDGGPYHGSHHILLAEHDILPSDPYGVLTKANTQQIEPWAHNQLIGNQYLLEAVARDGLWMANLGGSLKPIGKLLLGSLSHDDDHIVTPLVTKYHNFTYVQDSDSFVDGLANRQENILKEIVIGRELPRILNLLFCISLVFSPFLIGLIVRSCSLISICCLLLIPKEGQVRIIANLDWPHEPSKASGVMTSLVGNGYLMQMGNKKSQILVVGEGKTASAYPTEKLVILEPGAKVTIGKDVICSGIEPVDNEENIVDGRKLFINNEETSPMLSHDGIRIIGTGSPSKLEWKRWLD